MGLCSKGATLIFGRAGGEAVSYISASLLYSVDFRKENSWHRILLQPVIVDHNARDNDAYKLLKPRPLVLVLEALSYTSKETE